MTVKLRYIGDRVPGRENDFLPGVPAADHEVATLEEADALIGSGLYEPMEETPAEKEAAKLLAKAAKAEANAQEAARQQAAADAAAADERRAKEEKEARAARAHAQAERARSILRDIEGDAPA